MVAARVKIGLTNSWLAWLGVSEEAVRKELNSPQAERHLATNTLEFIPLAKVEGMERYEHGRALMAKAERGRGHTVFSLGLMSANTNSRPVPPFTPRKVLPRKGAT